MSTVAAAVSLVPAVPADAAGAAPGVEGWLPSWNTSAALASLRASQGLVATASPFWYSLSDDGSVAVSKGGYSTAALSTLRGSGARIVPTVADSAMNAPEAADFFADPAARAGLVTALAKIAADNGYDGLDIDMEALNFGGTATDRAAVRPVFTAFVREMATALHAAHRTLTVTVGARTSADDGAWAAFDLAAIGAVADEVRVMAYDQHIPSQAAGPIGSVSWARRVLAYVRTQVPARKLVLGIPAYGYEWAVPVSGTCPTGDGRPRGAVYTARQAAAAASDHGATPTWNAAAAERTFSYADPATYTGTDSAGDTVSCQVKRVVWYADAQSAAARMRLAASEGIAGVAVWALGDEDTNEWTALRGATGTPPRAAREATQDGD